MLISNKFCDLSLLHWVQFSSGLYTVEMWEGMGGQCDKKNLPHCHKEDYFKSQITAVGGGGV